MCVKAFNQHKQNLRYCSSQKIDLWQGDSSCFLHFSKWFLKNSLWIFFEALKSVKNPKHVRIFSTQQEKKFALFMRDSLKYWLYIFNVCFLGGGCWTIIYVIIILENSSTMACFKAFIYILWIKSHDNFAINLIPS